MNITQNFDWSQTQNKICVFIPNYKRSKYLEITIGYMQHQNPSDDIVYIIGNDTIDLGTNQVYRKFHNCFQFTIDREPDTSRNGCFVRNYFIKRCQSQWILQKDPECLLVGQNNWLSSLSLTDENGFYRATQVEMLDENKTNHIFNGQKPELNPEEVDLNKHFHIHHCLLTPTKILQQMHGYDEDFKFYGPEDLDMWQRLLASGLNQHGLDVLSLHLYHPRDVHFLNNTHYEMDALLRTKNPHKVIRNNEDWGNG